MHNKNKGRDSWHHLYYRKAWKQLRLDHLSEHPLCEYCKQDGKITLATVVDHIKPHKGDLQLFLDPHNLQSLCKLHHDSTKQKAEAHQIKEIGCDVNGYPLDKNHHFHK